MRVKIIKKKKKKIMRVKLDNYEKLLEFDFFYIVSRFFEKWN